MDAAHLGVAPACVDVVLLVLVLFHLQRPVEGLREARRVLRPGGRVATATWGSELRSRAARVWADCLDAHGAKEDDPVQQARHEPVSTPEKLETLLRVAELTPERCWAEEVVARCDLEKFVSIHTRLGPAKARFDSLAPGARTAFLAASRRRLAELAPEDFVARGQVVYSLASA
jgi:SAM-dependent methyltransferase